MLLFKSAIISSAFLLFGASPFTDTERCFNEGEVVEYCYELSVNVDISTIEGTVSTTTIARACGDSPQEGLEALGEAVRALKPDA